MRKTMYLYRNEKRERLHEQLTKRARKVERNWDAWMEDNRQGPVLPPEFLNSVEGLLRFILARELKISDGE